jgi:hypothetical protein
MVLSMPSRVMTGMISVDADLSRGRVASDPVVAAAS